MIDQTHTVSKHIVIKTEEQSWFGNLFARASSPPTYSTVFVKCKGSDAGGAMLHVSSTLRVAEEIAIKITASAVVYGAVSFEGFGVERVGVGGVLFVQIAGVVQL